MKKHVLQAHRGVSDECPENTMSAFRSAVCQGFGLIELDPAVTSDGEIVVIHDKTLNRTARNKDLSPIEKEIKISEITYREALQYDYGAFFSNKYIGEKIPLLSEALELAKENDIRIKIDNKFSSFSPDGIDNLFRIVKSSNAKVAMTCETLETVKTVVSRLPFAEVHFDGAVTAQVLEELSRIVDKEKLVVWLPFAKFGDWAPEPATEEICELVKKYARLGIWILSKQCDYDYVVDKFSPDIVETTGAIKPTVRKGVVCDAHTHSEHSHDSICKISDMARCAKSKGTTLVAVTDHCDIGFYEIQDVETAISDSVSDAKKHNAELQDIEILSGVEIGEGFWNKALARKIVKQNDCDIVIGSIHTVRFEGCTMPYSLVDFGKTERETVEKYIDKYFDDVLTMLNETDLDVLAHLTCLFRYTNGKYGLNISCMQYKEKIIEILKFIISHGIALEINTSCKGSAYDEYMPEEWIIKAYAEMGGYLVTCASDAHIAENAAYYFDELVSMLKKYGFRNIYYLKNRHLHQCAIE